MSLEGKVAVVTGAGSGIGRAIAQAMAARGARVAAVDLDPATAKETAELITRAGGRALARQADTSVWAEIDRAVTAAVGELGPLDIMVNNAGILDGYWNVDEVDPAVWNRVIAINLTGVFLGAKRALQEMLPRERGRIINMASVAGWIASGDGQAHYCAAKAGVMAFTRSVAAEAGKFGIRANAIAPGVIYNEFLTRIYPPGYFEERKTRAILGRLGEPPEVANLALFLASDDSAYITGEVFCISGGSYVRG
jgi:3-oxoacyl-[acyl-carrier protein] reductase